MKPELDIADNNRRKTGAINFSCKNFLVPRKSFLDIVDKEHDALHPSKHLANVTRRSGAVAGNV